MSCPGPSPIHTFAALPRELITLLAPRRTPAVSSPIGNSNSAISIYPSTGFRTLSNKNYISYVGTLKPDIAVGLADVSHGLKPGVKRVAKMADRTQDWVTQLLAEKRDGQAIFAPVLSIDFLDQWEYINAISDELAEDLSGLAFYDSNLLPDIPAATWISKLPRLSLDEPTSPSHILRQISLGMDIFTIPFISFATDAGIALTFRFPQPLPATTPSSGGGATPSSDETTPSNGNGTSTLPLGTDMWPKTHATSLIPISTACNCYTCTTHHRAFIQHLLAAKEMLGWALIQIHNHHILSEFFTAVRKSIASETFEADCAEFNRVYEAELPEKSGQGPRVRGYHFKSEGPSEPKKNKKAWGKVGAENVDVEERGEGGDIEPDELATELEEKGFAERLKIVET